MKSEMIEKFIMPQDFDITQFHGQSKKFLAFLMQNHKLLYLDWDTKFSEEVKNYQDSTEKNSNFFSKIDSHNIFLESYFGLDFSQIKPVKFKSINFDITRQYLGLYNEKIVEACSNASKIIPKKYHKLFKEYAITFGDYPVSMISPKEKKISIKLNAENDLLIISHDFIHELGHVIEYCNKNTILKKNLQFLKLRSYKKKGAYSIAKDTITNQFYNNFFNEYAGTVYTDSFYEGHNDPYTEVFSFGLGMLYYSPIQFYYQDPEFFRYVLGFLKD